MALGQHCGPTPCHNQLYLLGVARKLLSQLPHYIRDYLVLSWLLPYSCTSSPRDKPWLRDKNVRMWPRQPELCGFCWRCQLQPLLWLGKHYLKATKPNFSVPSWGIHAFRMRPLLLSIPTDHHYSLEPRLGCQDAFGPLYPAMHQCDGVRSFLWTLALRVAGRLPF